MLNRLSMIWLYENEIYKRKTVLIKVKSYANDFFIIIKLTLYYIVTQ